MRGGLGSVWHRRKECKQGVAQGGRHREGGRGVADKGALRREDLRRV